MFEIDFLDIKLGFLRLFFYLAMEIVQLFNFFIMGTLENDPQKKCSFLLGIVSLKVAHNIANVIFASSAGGTIGLR